MQLITCSLGLIMFQLVLRVVGMYTLYNDIETLSITSVYMLCDALFMIVKLLPFQGYIELLTQASCDVLSVPFISRIISQPAVNHV